MPPPSPEQLEQAYQTARATLLAERTPEGHWVGELSTSALSTATTVSALALVQKNHGKDFSSLIAGGTRWLVEHQNEDGGWGDTVRSFSNISTTMLCRAAFHLTGTAVDHPTTLERINNWLGERYGTTSEQLAQAIRDRYGKDHTFSVPILMTSALAGLVPWSEVPPLRFELACFPQSWFRFLTLQVVSYALPALIAIGQTIFHHRPPRNPLTRWIRRSSIQRSLGVLQRIQPSSGGFLEAAPLTSFVTLGLVSSGKGDHPVVTKCLEFLVNSVRPDGSWPIDTNLSTWVTTLSINALAVAGDVEQLDQQTQMRDWLLAQQYRERHPYTGAAPGGWAWTPLPGGVPDADDTPGAILALSHLPALDTPARDAGVAWLKGLQNRDGGWPTFCRGWGTLPFDRSGSDLTAHVLRALAAVGEQDSRMVCRGLEYLGRQQREDGSWVPLWFGNQHEQQEENPTYGTARVLAAYRDLNMMDSESAQRGIVWILRAQNADGGWGGAPNTPSSIEETALAVEVLLDADSETPSLEAVNKGLAWLVHEVEEGSLAYPTPMGFYFAKLWYFEKLYPIIFSVAALGRARRKNARQ